MFWEFPREMQKKAECETSILRVESQSHLPAVSCAVLFSYSTDHRVGVMYCARDELWPGSCLLFCTLVFKSWNLKIIIIRQVVLNGKW